MGVGFPFFLRDPQDIKFLYHKDQTEQTRKALGDHRRPRGSRHAHLEIHDEHKIQDHVHNRGDHQKNDRCLSVSQRPYDTRENVVEEHRGNAYKNYVNIGIGILENICGRIHPAKNVPAQKRHGKRHNHGEKHAQPDAVCHIFAHTRIIPGAKLMRNRYGKAHADSHAEPDHQKVHGTRGTHRRQRAYPQISSHDQRIDQIIKLLE